MKRYPNKYGYCYVALNPGSEIQAIRSAKTLRKHDRMAHITLFTDQLTDGGLGGVFDNVIKTTSKDPHPVLREFPQYPDQGIFAKARCIPKAPYEYCIFMDYDVRIYGNISDLFTLVEDGGFDFCATLDAGEVSMSNLYPEIPYPISKFHLGVLAWHNTPAMRELFSLWRSLLIEKCEKGIAGGAIDEWTFSAAAYKTRSVRWSMFSSHYCCRFIFPYIVRDDVKVLHGRSEDYDGVINDINSVYGLRVCFGNKVLARYEPGIGLILTDAREKEANVPS